MGHTLSLTPLRGGDSPPEHGKGDGMSRVAPSDLRFTIYDLRFYFALPPVTGRRLSAGSGRSHSPSPVRVLWLVCLISALAGPLARGDMVRDAVDKVSLEQYRAYQVDIQNMGLGRYGGPTYNQHARNRDGWANGGTLGNLEARLYLVEQLSCLGIEASVQGIYGNVVAELPGRETPQNIYIVCGHYDTTSSGERPGGDDNASGTAGVLEAARVLTQYRFKSTLRFIAFNAEEEWMKGSQEYVNALPKDTNILGVINLDMILRPGWDGDPHAALDLEVESLQVPVCVAWVNTFVNTAATYTPSLLIDPLSHYPADWDAGDHGPFISAGYPALVAIENSAEEIWWDQSNAYYHTAQDASDSLANDPQSPSGITYDYTFATEVVQATVATLASKAAPLAQHAPVLDPCEALATSGAADLEFFSIGSDHYLAVANMRNDSTYDVNSLLYRWDGTSFVEFQSIPTQGAKDWEFFTIADVPYLAVANSRSDVSHDVDSKIFRWDGGRFVEHQSLPTNGANDWQFFTIAGESYLAVANGRYDGPPARGAVGANTDSRIYRWEGTGFVEYQALATNGAEGLEFFTIDDTAYLAVANAYNDQTHNVPSRIFRWDGGGFAPFQYFPTHGASDWKYFTIDGNSYLALANHGDDPTCNVDSEVFQWDGQSFVAFQSIPTHGATDWEFFTAGGDLCLAVANAYDDHTADVKSTIYRWSGRRLVEWASVPTHGAGAWEFFVLGDRQYLGMANSQNDSTYDVESTLYRYRGTGPDHEENESLPDSSGSPQDAGAL
jgi:hypothetical protein